MGYAKMPNSAHSLGQTQLQDGMKTTYVLEFGAAYIRDFTVNAIWAWICSPEIEVEQNPYEEIQNS